MELKVYLDDERETPEGYYRVYDAPEAIDTLDSWRVTEISLDHDLGDEGMHGTGYDVLLWIENEVVTNPDFELPILKVHSANPPARKRMLAAIESIERRYSQR